jgi:hypothetical protein
MRQTCSWGIPQSLRTKSVLNAVPSAAAIATGSALPAKYATRVNDELIDIGEDLFVTRATPQTNAVKYYLRQDNAYYQVRWEADYGAYRLVDPKVAGSTQMRGDLISRTDGRWTRGVAPGGLHGGGFRNLWRRYRGSPIPDDHISGISPEQASSLRALLVKGADVAEDNLKTACELLRSADPREVQYVNKTLEIFWGSANPEDIRDFTKTVYRTLEYSKRVNYSKLRFNDVYIDADGKTRSPGTVMTTWTPPRIAGGIAQVDDALEDAEVTIYREGMLNLKNKVSPEKFVAQVAQVEMHEWHHVIAHTSHDIAYGAYASRGDAIDLVKILNLSPAGRRVNADNFLYAVRMLKLARSDPASYNDFLSRYGRWSDSKSDEILWYL